MTWAVRDRQWRGCGVARGSAASAACINPVGRPHVGRPPSATRQPSPHHAAPPSHAERELLLLKLRVKPGAERAEVLQLATVFRARVVDVADATLTLSVTGDPGKVCGCECRGGQDCS